MTGFLLGLSYLSVLALVVGCFVYLFVTRDQGRTDGPPEREFTPPSEESAMRAKALSGPYRLSDLERIFEQLGAIEAWGMVVELSFTTQGNVQMILNRNEVELCAPLLDPEDTDPFRRAAAEVGLQARPGYTEGQYCVDVTGTWPGIASTLRSIIRSIHGVGESEEVHVHIFN